MLLTWDVGQHDDDEAVVVVEGHVVLVGEPHGEHSRSAHERQSGVDGQQFPGDSQGVQDDEEVVPRGGDTRRTGSHPPDVETVTCLDVCLSCVRAPSEWANA